MKTHPHGKCRIKRDIPLGTPVVNLENTRSGRVIILNPSDEAAGLVGVRYVDNGHEDKVLASNLI